MSADLSVFMEGGRASGSAPDDVGTVMRFVGIHLRTDSTRIPKIQEPSIIMITICSLCMKSVVITVYCEHHITEIGDEG